MQEKSMYTLRELFTNLPISLNASKMMMRREH
jgi:hypothetical protein